MMFVVAAALRQKAGTGITLASKSNTMGTLFLRSFASQSPLVVPVELVSDTL